MVKPVSFPQWATAGQLDPITGAPNKVEPTSEFKVSGLKRREPLPRAYVNYQFDLISDWLEYFDENLSGSSDLVIATPSDYGAAGNGITDDTQAILDTIAAADVVVIERPYLFTSNIVCDKFIKCISSGELIYDGTEGTEQDKPLTITAKFFGDIKISGSNKSVRLLFLDPQGGEQYGGKVIVQDLVAANDTQYISAGCVTLTGTVNIESIHAKNFTNTGHVNDSLPQGVVPVSGSTLKTNALYGEDIESLLVTPSGSEVYVSTIECTRCEDNGIYNLGGKIVFGTMSWTAGTQDEPIVNRGYLYGDLLIVEGAASACFNVEDAEYTEIRDIIARPLQGTNLNDPIAVRDNIPNQVWYHRSGNTANGPIKVGSVTGDVAVSVIRTGYSSGSTERFALESMDINLWYDESDTDWDRGNFLQLDGITQFDIREAKVNIIDAKGTIDLEGVERLFNAYWSPTKFSTLENLDVIFTNMDGSFVTTGSLGANFRGQRQTSNLVIRGARWQVNTTTVYAREQTPDRTQRDVFLSGQEPQSGYWFEGQIFQTLDSDDIEFFKCNTTGEVGLGAKFSRQILDGFGYTYGNLKGASSTVYSANLWNTVDISGVNSNIGGAISGNSLLLSAGKYIVHAQVSAQDASGSSNTILEGALRLTSADPAFDTVEGCKYRSQVETGVVDTLLIQPSLGGSFELSDSATVTLEINPSQISLQQNGNGDRPSVYITCTRVGIAN